MRKSSATDTALVVAYWIFWFAIFFLAAQQAGYLALGYPRLEFSIVAGLVGIGLMHVLKTQQRGQDDGSDRRQTALIRALTLRAGMPTTGLYSVRDLEADPAMMAIVETHGGINAFNTTTSPSEAERALNLAMPDDLVDKAERWRELHDIDRKILKIAERIDGRDKGLLHDIRRLMLTELYRGGESGHSDVKTIAELLARLPEESANHRFLRAIEAEISDRSSAGIRIGDWNIVRSWLRHDDLDIFEDLAGADGLPLPPMPQALKEALKLQTPGKIYTS